jgi:hypothetical protein
MKSIIKKQLKEQPAGCSLERKTEKMCQPYLGLDTPYEGGIQGG